MFSKRVSSKRVQEAQGKAASAPFFLLRSKKLLINYCSRHGLICCVLRVKGIIEVIVGKLYLQFVAGVA
jgi:hypothetical protein